jgi:5'-methylthioadenosine phosphorylase
VSSARRARIGIIGGSGLYELAGLEGFEEVRVDTPFGPPSDAFVVGAIEGREVAFLARHGRAHDLLPSEINYRANIYGFKLLGVERILSASAVGSMKEEIRPQDVVLPEQFLDRTRGRASTFFGGGIVAHVMFADPICPEARRVMLEAARREGATAHDGGVYLCMEGPAFSTRAESLLYRSWGVDVIGMTNLQEAKLSREAEICYATLALVTDFDCWHEEEDDVTIAAVLDNLRANAKLAAAVLRRATIEMPEKRTACGCGRALEHAIITRRDAIPAGTRARLEAIVGRHLK